MFDKSMIQLSIITINFNNAEGLERTFGSIAKLKNPAIEYIVIDAGSTDGSQDLINRHQNLYDQVIIEKDKGIYDGMNKGIALATGKYVIFINSGDELLTDDFLKDLESDAMQADIIYGNTKIKYENGFDRVAQASDIADLWKSLPFIHQSVLVKSAILKENLFDLSYKYCSDYELFCRLKAQSFSFKKIDQLIAQIEAGGVSDLRRDLATSEVYSISNTYHQLNAEQKAYFQKEIKKGKRVQAIKKLIPKSLVKFGLKMKYKK